MTRMPDKTNSWNPSTFVQITDTELETKDKVQQEHPPATSVKSHQHQKRLGSHHRQRRRLEPVQPKPLSSSDKESSKNLTEPSSKNKDSTQINVQSTSDGESESSDESSSEENSSSGPSSDKEWQGPARTCFFLTGREGARKPKIFENSIIK
jgi:hypothetical protein